MYHGHSVLHGKTRLQCGSREFERAEYCRASTQYFDTLLQPCYDWMSARIHQPAPAVCLAECQTFKADPACAWVKRCSPATCN